MHIMLCSAVRSNMHEVIFSDFTKISEEQLIMINIIYNNIYIKYNIYIYIYIHTHTYIFPISLQYKSTTSCRPELIVISFFHAKSTYLFKHSSICWLVCFSFTPQTNFTKVLLGSGSRLPPVV